MVKCNILVKLPSEIRVQRESTVAVYRGKRVTWQCCNCSSHVLTTGRDVLFSFFDFTPFSLFSQSLCPGLTIVCQKTLSDTYAPPSALPQDFLSHWPLKSSRILLERREGLPPSCCLLTLTTCLLSVWVGLNVSECVGWSRHCFCGSWFIFTLSDTGEGCVQLAVV